MLIEIEDQKPQVRLPKEGVCLAIFQSDLEHTLILQALERTQGSKADAARLLSINRTTLVGKMRKLGMTLNPPCNRGVRKPRQPGPSYREVKGRKYNIKTRLLL
jgi:hypothetical protein